MASKMTIQFEHSKIDIMLNNYDRKVRNPRPLLERVGRYIQQQTMKMFKGPRPDNYEVRGERWEPLTEATVKQKEKGHLFGSGASRPLVRSGRLMSDLSSERAIRISGDNMYYGEKIPEYGQYHQTGGRRLPQRRFLFLTSEDNKEIEKMTHEFLERG